MTDHLHEARELLAVAQDYREDGAPRTAAECEQKATRHLLFAAAESIATLHQLRLGDSVDVSLTVYAARCESLTLGLYRTRTAARDHCVESATEAGFSQLEWTTEADSDEDDLFGTGIDAFAGLVPLDYSVVPVEVQAAYDPDREG